MGDPVLLSREGAIPNPRSQGLAEAQRGEEPAPPPSRVSLTRCPDFPISRFLDFSISQCPDLSAENLLLAFRSPSATRWVEQAFRPAVKADRIPGFSR
jgi:hypothetical protein